MRGGPRIAPGPVKVTVKTTEGKPAVRAVVRIGGRQAVTDDKGVVWFDGLPAGQARLLIEQPGYDRLEKAMDSPAGKREPVEIVVSPTVVINLAGALTLQGHGGGLAGAKVVLTPAQVAAVRQGVIEFRTDWEGKFQAMDVPVGAYGAQVSAAGAITTTFDLAVKSPMPAIAWQLAAETRPAAMTVSVVDAGNGSAVAGAKVTLAEAGTRGVLGEATADAGGRVAFKDLKLGRLNWEDAKGKLAVARRNVTVLAEAKGYEKTIVNAQLDDNATATVRMNSTAMIEERKPNGSLAAAQALPTGATVSFKIARNDNRSFFKFHLGYPLIVSLEIAAGAEIATLMRVYSAEGKETRQQPAYAGNANVLRLGGLPIGDYYVSIEQWGQNNASKKPLQFRVVCEPGADALEPNNTAQTARIIQVGEEVRACILPIGDVNWYRFELRRPGQVRVTMPGTDLGRWLAICDENGKRLGETSAYAGDVLSRVVQLGKGRYAIEVHQWGDNSESVKPYMLRLEAIEDDGIDDPPVAGGPMRAARTIELGKLAGSTIWPVGDVDVYAVSVPSAGRFHVDFRSFTTMRVLLRGSEGSLLAEHSVYAKDPGHIAFDIHKPSTLFLEVHQWGDNDASPWPYQISTSFEPCDERELAGRNDSADTATPIELNQPVRGSIMPVGDVDFYRVEVDHPGYLQVRAVGPTSLRVRMLDGRKRSQAEWCAYATNVLNGEIPVFPGAYFIEMHQWGDSDASSTPYELVARLVRAEPQERVPLAKDPPRILKPGEAQTFRIDHVGDVDHYVFSIPQAGKWTLRFRNPLPTFYRLYDDQQNKLVQEQSFYAGEGRAEFEVKGPTRYRMEVHHWGDTDRHGEFPGFVMADMAGRDIPCEICTAQADPYQPTKVVFTRKAVPGMPGGIKMSVDADGDGKTIVDVTSGTGTFTYPSEGNYKAVAIVEGAGGVTARAVLGGGNRAAGAKGHLRFRGPSI